MIVIIIIIKGEKILIKNISPSFIWTFSPEGGDIYVPRIPPENINDNINIIMLGMNILGVDIPFIVNKVFIKNERNNIKEENKNIAINSFWLNPIFVSKRGLLLT